MCVSLFCDTSDTEENSSLCVCVPLCNTGVVVVVVRVVVMQASLPYREALQAALQVDNCHCS